MKSHGNSGRTVNARHDTKRNVINRWVTTTGEGVDTPEKVVVPHEREAVQPACDEISVACWCGRSSVWVPQAYPRAGLTKACGTTRCHPPADVAYEQGVRVPKASRGVR